jgi:hypothetical protein
MQLRINYLSLYFLAEYSFGKKIIFSLNAAPYIGLLVDNTIRTEFPDSVG